ncbi:MAG: nucleotidyltransferase domain-containing protein [Ignavibacteriales bacterium]|nr:nucleotidyltransferase domain-containing protein [Ignavibacteriales bacterium]
MDKKVNKSIKEFALAVSKEFAVKKIVLYGSYASGTQTENSDIDIAVIVDKYNGNVLKANSKLFAIVRNIDIRIEPIFLEEKYDKSGFVESILKNGKVIYTAN